MNPVNITKETKLYGFVGENVTHSEFLAVVNRYFDSNNIDAFCSVFNIRFDDLAFFLHNIKTRSIEGIFIEQTYAKAIFSMLDEVLGENFGIVDTVFIREKRLIGTLARPAALAKMLNEKSMAKDKKIYIYKINEWAKAFIFELMKFQPAKIIPIDSISKDEILDSLVVNFSREERLEVNNKIDFFDDEWLSNFYLSVVF
ncbi:MAG: hypothetical protein QG567_1982 [Campylobacterota bacterium]|nr:hypothetical protein [Campylobacterota bacterium]